MTPLQRGLGIILVCVGGCSIEGPSYDADPADSEEASEVIGGEETKYPKQVWYLETKRPSGAYGCTATLISPRVLLTAAHCVVDTPKGTSVRAFTGSHVVEGDGVWLSVSGVRPHPDFLPKHPELGSDVGVAWLAEPYTELAPRELSDDAPEAWVGKRVRIVGYGDNAVLANGTSVGSGVKRTSLSTVNSVSDKFVNIGDSNLAACHGDSGGPALVYDSGVPFILALTSFGYTCGTDAFYTRVDLFRDFIEQAMRDGR